MGSIGTKEKKYLWKKVIINIIGFEGCSWILIEMIVIFSWNIIWKVPLHSFYWIIRIMCVTQLVCIKFDLGLVNDSTTLDIRL